MVEKRCGTFVFLLLVVCFFRFLFSSNVDEKDASIEQSATSTVDTLKAKRYLLYDVNRGEGFNLRRDVYMRIANLVYKLRNEVEEKEDWTLVLPPWGRIYHWKSKDIGSQFKLKWALFFDLSSLNKHIPVIEFEDYLRETGKEEIEEIYYLQHYKEGWKDGEWEEKYDVRPCIDPSPYLKTDDGVYESWFWGYEDVIAKKFTCLSIQGHARTLIPLLQNSSARSIFVDRAEVVLHDSFGNDLYWKARRSMRFNKELRLIGDEFRQKHLNSSDELDRTQLIRDWRYMKPKAGSALGGPYVSVHLRREDFLYGHGDEVPDLKYAAEQIQKVLKKLNLTKVFVATDAPQKEFQELKTYLPDAVKFEPSLDIRKKYKDGGIAIIDQWICAHARFFLGTHESTFSFRIQEEREILGFSPETTFNRLCPNGQKTCHQPSQWKIVYEGQSQFDI